MQNHFGDIALLVAVFSVAVSAQICGSEPVDDKIRVVVWDEQQPQQRQAYDNFLGNAIAEHLGKQSDTAVRSMRLDDADQGLSDAVLDYAQVLIWWGHVRQLDVPESKGRDIVERIKRGQLSLIALHSAHWAVPFVEAIGCPIGIKLRRTGPPFSSLVTRKSVCTPGIGGNPPKPPG